MKINFDDRIVGITGYSSLNIDYNLAVARIIELEGGKVIGNPGYNENWERGQLILVGDMDFDEIFLKASIKVGMDCNFTCQYLSLEDFWDYYDDNYHFEPYFEGDARIENHAGLRFLTSLYFEYPEVDILGYKTRTSENVIEWNVESILKLNFGYSVKLGISAYRRKSALLEAVNSPDIISLKEIAEHIAFLINTRKGNKDMKYAIERWTSDLNWLKEEHYDKSIHKFRFPTPY